MKTGWERPDQAGFTLLELLTVMAIMMLLMGVTVGGYYGFLRGASRQGAVMNLRSSLSAARQFAVTRRCRTYVFFWQNGTNGHYVACMEEGRAVGPDANFLTIEYPRWTENQLIGSDIYNLTTGEYGTVLTNGTAYLRASNTVTHNVLTFNTNDKYGWPIRSETHLPEGMVFGDGTPASAPAKVIFNADGSTPPAASEDYSTIDVWELNPPMRAQKIHVKALTGKITVTDS